MTLSRLLLAGSAIGAALVAAPALAQDAAHAHAAPAAGTADVIRDAADLPGPLARRGPATVKVDLETVEVTGQLADGSSYHYWTFNRKVPGPFVRVRVGDTVEVRMKNADDSVMMHNVDFHAVTGPGGGGAATMAAPGETKGFTFKALAPGLYVYHCATPMVAQHIANGMYGMILVEPEEGLAKVDREFYVMQGEIYTEQTHGTEGTLTESLDKLLAEQPEYYVFNGAADALIKKPLKAKTGETVRVFFGVGGPNKTSSFHVIGEIFDKAFPLASITSAPMTDVQTITVPPGGAAVTEFKLDVPGRFILVDHALSRMERGLKGLLVVEGPERAELFRSHQKDDAAAEATGH
ncbi:copper-containing nitrite reductase [Sphingosinicella sp. LY1275]|uniref:copper-containing nitrite reductase n=1 Tax=Sphingosinicella sp. LY1275 TaxID=3095379 RepID=UPI002ADEE434|nr:copper-containing nitrite reductase [Sphingosinicella sp. LY1275]MEA1015297.1 copper-containing nitrite reductase [Sphingosinicella sp. LY1275]